MKIYLAFLFVLATVQSAVGQSARIIENYVVVRGECTHLRLAGQDYKCTGMIYFQTKETGRAQFTVPVINPEDSGHVISFSGSSDRKPKPDLYELQIDRILLNSVRSPRGANNLPIPKIERAAGICRQVGNAEQNVVSGISCKAMDRNGQEYVVEFIADGSAPKVITSAPPKVAGPAWVGRWYSDDVKVCKGNEGETEGLVVYKPKEVIGIENICKITAQAQQGTRTALKMRCNGEGMTSNEQEIVEVVNGKLRRTVAGRRGERTMVFDYNRCP